MAPNDWSFGTDSPTNRKTNKRLVGDNVNVIKRQFARKPNSQNLSRDAVPNVYS